MQESLLRQHDVMISYSTRQQLIADDVCHLLKEKGYDVWMAPDSIPAGQSYDNEIFAAIENSSLVLFLMSEASLCSVWCKAELKYAVNTNKRVLPVRIDDVESPYDKLGRISCVLGKRQIFDMYPEYSRKLQLVEGKVDDLLHNKENVVRPYPVVSSEMQDLDNICIGRQQETRELSELLLEAGSVNLYGFGGIGKTVVIKKFFNDYFLTLPYITIHVAKYTHSIENTIAHIPFVGFDDGNYLSQLRDDSITKEEALFAKKTELLSALSSSCLLIIDGMDYAPQQEVEVVKSLRCHKIIVSRNRYDGMSAYEVREMTAADLHRFFHDVQNAAEEDAAVDAIIQRVDRHTLTVSLIAGYCREFGYTPQEVLEDGVCQDLEKYDSNDGKISDLLDKIPLSPEEIYCLKVLSLFPNGISKGKLQKVDRNVIRTAQQMVRKNLVIGSSSAYQLHQIVRELVYEKFDMDANTIVPFLDTFLDIMRKLNFEESELYYTLRNMDRVLTGEGDLLIKLYHMIGHWVCDYTYVSLFHVNKELYKTAPVCNQHLSNTKQLHLDRFLYAESMEKKALDLALASDSDYARTIRPEVLSMVGAANFNMNRWENALEYQKKALAAAEACLPEDAPIRHAILSRQGLTAMELGQFELALDSFRQLYALEEKRNFTRTNRANVVYRLGLLYKAQNDMPKAKEYFLQALEDRSNPLAESDYLLNLAEVCLSMGEREQAREYYKRGRDLRLTLMETEEAARDFLSANDPVYL